MRNSLGEHCSALYPTLCVNSADIDTGVVSRGRNADAGSWLAIRSGVPPDPARHGAPEWRSRCPASRSSSPTAAAAPTAWHSLGACCLRPAASRPEAPHHQRGRQRRSHQDLYAADGTLITELAGEERRASLPLDQIPKIIQNAVVAIEDERFWEHNGVDPKGIVRAAGKTLRRRGGRPGWLDDHPAVREEHAPQPRAEHPAQGPGGEPRHPARTHPYQGFILEQYLNTIWFGNRSYGVQQASTGYFGHDVGSESRRPRPHCSPASSSHPVRFDPYKDMARHQATQHRPRQDAWSSATSPTSRARRRGRSAHRAAATARPTRPRPVPRAALRRRGQAVHPDRPSLRGRPRTERNNLLINGGLRIYTTVDLAMQAKAEADVKKVYPDQARPISDRSARTPTSGWSRSRARTGYVRAMVGGYNYFDTDTAGPPLRPVQPGRRQRTTGGIDLQAHRVGGGAGERDQADGDLPVPRVHRHPGLRPGALERQG